MYKITLRKELNPTVTMMEIEAPLVAKKAEPGQFIILRVNEDGERIPLTIAGYDREKGTVNGTIVKAIETAKELGYVEAGDLTVATAGDSRMSVQLEDKVSSTNVAYVAQVR